MPKDRRIFITLAVDMDRHPKLSDLTDGQKWLIVRAIMHCREFLTDGVIKLADWNKMGTNRNRIAVESTKIIVVDREKKVAILNDFSNHQQTRAEVEKAIEAKKNAGQQGGKARAANAKKSSNGQAAAKADAKQTLKQNQAEEEEEKELSTNVDRSAASVEGDLTEATNVVSLAAHTEETRGPVVPSNGWSIVRRAVPKNLPQATKTELAMQISGMLNEGIDEASIVAGIEEWMRRDKAGPRLLPHLVADAVKAEARQSTPGNTSQGARGAATTKAEGWLDIGNRAIAAYEAQQAALGA